MSPFLILKNIVGGLTVLQEDMIDVAVCMTIDMQRQHHNATLN